MTARQWIDPIGPSTTEDFTPEDQRVLDKYAPSKDIAEQVILARTRLGITQRELADAIKTSNTQISRIESGRARISVRTLTRLGDALGISFAIPAKPRATIKAVARRVGAGSGWGSVPVGAMTAESTSRR